MKLGKPTDGHALLKKDERGGEISGAHSRAKTDAPGAQSPQGGGGTRAKRAMGAGNEGGRRTWNFSFGGGGMLGTKLVTRSLVNLLAGPDLN